MKILLTTTAAIGLLAATTGQSWAFGWFPPPPPPPPPVPSCDDLCDPGEVDITQTLEGFQKAINLIVDVTDATDIVQTAVNAGNLVSLADLQDEFDPIDLGTIDQSASVVQFASNLLDGNSFSTINSIQQAATNVVNSITGDTAVNINQDVSSFQGAFNTLKFGDGGYDSDIDVSADGAEMTQAAVNAANLVDIGVIHDNIVQSSTGTQVAINTASYEAPFFYNPWDLTLGGDVYDLGQSAVNVTNSVTVGEFDLLCPCGYEVDQYADAAQVALNSLSAGYGDVSNIVQSATNIANSISLPSLED